MTEKLRKATLTEFKNDIKRLHDGRNGNTSATDPILPDNFATSATWNTVLERVGWTGEKFVNLRVYAAIAVCAFVTHLF